MVDNRQLGAAFIAFALLMMASPFALARSFTNATGYSLALSSILVFYSFFILIGGIACYLLKLPEKEEAPKNA